MGRGCTVSGYHVVHIHTNTTILLPLALYVPAVRRRLLCMSRTIGHLSLHLNVRI